jgi:hypothetical protein
MMTGISVTNADLMTMIYLKLVILKATRSNISVTFAILLIYSPPFFGGLLLLYNENAFFSVHIFSFGRGNFSGWEAIKADNPPFH